MTRATVTTMAVVALIGLGAALAPRPARSAQETVIRMTAKKFEYATLPFGEVYQLGAALTYLDHVGVDRIERHTVALARDLREGLAALGFRLFTPPDNHTSIVSVHLDRNQARAREVLDGAKVQVSFREKGTLIRVSPALFNTQDEIRRFLDHAKRFA